MSARRGRRQLLHPVVVGMERERNERLEAAGLVLQRAGAQHVVDAFLGGLDVAVEHRHVRAHAEPVGEPVNGQVAVGVRLVVADLGAHALGEDLGAAAGQGVEPRVHEIPEHLLVGHAVELGEERDLDRGKALQVDLGPDALEAAEHLQVVVPRQIRMQAVDHVHLGQRLVGPLAQLAPGLLQAHRVRAVVTRLQPREGAEQAARDTHVGRLEAHVVVEERAAGVALLALPVGQPADRQQVRSVEQPDPVLQVETDASIQLVGNVPQPRRGNPRVHRSPRETR